MSTKIINLKPKGSMLSHSEMTGQNYHVIKFYTRVINYGGGFQFKGYEATEKHKLGECKHCKVK